jgi:hypothetical protein
LDVLVQARREALSAETVTERPLPVLMLPSVTVMVDGPAVYRVICPLFEPDTVATPLAKVIGSDVPKFTAVPVLLLTVGLVPLGLTLEPLKVRLLSPV